jgi:hypothetical protein
MSSSRRKELKQAYKLQMQPMGIFVIRNLVTGKTLLDSSNNLPAIINRHRFALQLGAHTNKELMVDWHLYGEEGFVFEVVDEIKQSTDPAYDYKAELSALLDLWREKYPLGAANSYL